MKKVLFILIVSLSVICINAQNLITNGGFETWTNHAAAPVGWSITGTAGTSSTFVSGIQHDGTIGNILNLIEPVSAGSKALGTPVSINIQLSGTYRVSFWVKSNGTNNVALISNRLIYGTTSTYYLTNIASNQTYTVMADWTQMVNDIVVPAGFTPGNYKFQINWSNLTGTKLSNFFIDDINVQLVLANRPQVTPVTTIGNATNISAAGFIANWTPTTDINAVGYDINVYWGSVLFSTTNVSEKLTSSALITGLIPNQNYTYNVIVKGNGINSIDANPSPSSATFTSLDALSPENSLKIILKLDDFSAASNNSPFKPVMDYLISKQLKAGFGAIANRFDATAYSVLKPYLNALNPKGDTLFEVWNHGYDHVNSEFLGTTYAYQKSHFDLATQTIKSLLGIQMHSFGAPFNGSDTVTNRVISQDTNYKVFIFSTIKPNDNTGIVSLNQRVDLESPTGKPNYAAFVSNYNSYKNTYKDYMVFQGHPAGWSADLFEQFKLIIEFLLAQGCEFVRPFDYYNTLINKQTELHQIATAKNIRIISFNDKLEISGINIDGKFIEVYNITGKKIISKLAHEGVNNIEIRERGTLIVKIGSELTKVFIL